MAQELDEVIAIRYRIIYDGDSIYVSISHEAKEIFISSVSDQIPKTAAIYDSLTRMISMSWRSNDLADVIKQLHKASRNKFDLPGMLAELLEQKGE